MNTASIFFSPPKKSALSRYQFKKKERKEQLCSSPKPLLALVRLEKVKEKAPSCFYQVERNGYTQKSETYSKL